MRIELIWDNPEKTILRFRRKKNWTIDDYHKAIDEAVAMLEELDHKVHVIQDATEEPRMPPHALMHFKTGNTKLAPYSKHTAIVGDDAFMQALFDMFKRLNVAMSGNYIMVNTVEEAHAAFAKRDASEAES